MAYSWLSRHPWTLPYVAVIVTVSLVLQVAWR
jgi:hypothetical protein